MFAYLYPARKHRRKHGPRGYRAPSEFREWLRDEFMFRCVYCLEREQWGNRLGHFHVEHFLPVAHRPDGRLEYENLLDSCQSCNLLKADQSVPDPLRILTRRAVVVKKNGLMQGKTKEARRLIDLLQLNSRSYRQRRRLMIAILSAVSKVNPDLYVELMSFPDDLPNLSVLNPPGGNSRPSGINTSFYALRQDGKLPMVY
jgi:hypothetical protein